MALADKDRHPSRYADVPAAEVAATFTRNSVTVRTVSLVAVLVVFLCYLTAGDPTSAVDLVVMLVLGVFVLAVEVLTLLRDWGDILQVLTHDCDPQKAIEFLPTLIERYGRRRKGTAALLETWYAQASYLLGYYDVALAWAQVAGRRQPKDPHWVAILDVYGHYHLGAGRLDLVAQTREQLVAIRDRNARRDKVRRVAQLVIDTLDEGVAAARGDWQLAWERTAAIDAQVTTPVQELSNNYRKARLADAQGNLPLARQLFLAVAATRGSCKCIEDARAWLAAHPA